MHYTSVRNIDRCLDTLFLDDLRHKLAVTEGERVSATRKRKLEDLQHEIARITVGEINLNKLIQFSGSLAAWKFGGCKLILGGAFAPRGCKTLLIGSW